VLASKSLNSFINSAENKLNYLKKWCYSYMRKEGEFATTLHPNTMATQFLNKRKCIKSHCQRHVTLIGLRSIFLLFLSISFLRLF